MMAKKIPKTWQPHPSRSKETTAVKSMMMRKETKRTMMEKMSLRKWPTKSWIRTTRPEMITMALMPRITIKSRT